MAQAPRRASSMQSRREIQPKPRSADPAAAGPGLDPAEPTGRLVSRLNLDAEPDELPRPVAPVVRQSCSHKGRAANGSPEPAG